LPNQLKDLRLLQKLGLSFGATMKGRDFFKLMFKKIKSTTEICRLDVVPSSLWYDPCAPLKTCAPNFIKGRKLLMKKLKIYSST